MNVQNSIISGITAAGLTYLLDPDRGKRRRALILDKATSLASHSGDTLRKVGRDLSNRSWGTVASARSHIPFRSRATDDQVIEARIRTKMGRIISHPSSIQVSSEHGRVTVRGPILATECDRFLRAVRSSPGVREVDNQLEVHEHAADIPGLQGGGARSGATPEIWQTNWTPGVRMLLGAAGGALAMYGLSRRDPLGALTGVVGAGLLARAATNLEARRLLGVGGGRRAVNVQKTLTIHAPVEEVFRFWSNYQNFPRFMTHIREVRDHGNGRSHWVADGPAGSSVAWDAEVTRCDRNRCLAWKSIPGSTVDNAGVVHFEPTPDGSTRVHMQISYNPPAGAVGHAVASLFRRDLKSELDDDMVRLKSLIEIGKTRSSSGQRITRSELDLAPEAAIF